MLCFYLEEDVKFIILYYKYNIMNIYSCVDQNNIDKIYVLFYSVFRNTNNFDKLKFYIITDGYPKEKIPDFLKGKLRIGIINFDEYWKNMLDKFNKNFYKNSNWCKSDLNFARFFVFELFPEIDRVIYLDWDMIVQTDIYNLNKHYLDNKIIVADIKEENTLLKNLIQEYKKITRSKINMINSTFKINLFNKSHNSGFYIISKEHFGLKKMSSFIKKLINFQSKNNIFRFGTQVIMNLLPYEFEFIDYKWNTNELDKSSNIIHWSGSKKPWISENEIWFNYHNDLYGIIKAKNNTKSEVKIEKKKFLIKKLLYRN